MTKVRNYIILIFLIQSLCFGLNKAKAQKDDEDAKDRAGLWFGFNTGFYFANRYQASFYDGNPLNENSINYILNNPYIRNDIKNALGIPNGSFNLEDLPSRMKYR